MFHSRGGAWFAKPYASYYAACRQSFKRGAEIATPNKTRSEFESKGFVTHWSERTQEAANSILRKIKAAETSGNPWNDDFTSSVDVWHEYPEIEQIFKTDLEPFFVNILGCEIKIFFARLYKSVHSSSAHGSQLWHADGGPGTCLNVLFYLCETHSENGAMEIVNWKDSFSIYRNEKREYRRIIREALSKTGISPSRIESRELLSSWFGEKIIERRAEINQPIGRPGTVLAFRNNNLHKGGNPAPGNFRYAIVFHIYPGEIRLDYDYYRKMGSQKSAPYPKSPKFGPVGMNTTSAGDTNI